VFRANLRFSIGLRSNISRFWKRQRFDLLQHNWSLDPPAEKESMALQANASKSLLADHRIDEPSNHGNDTR
jgi:hypothetical protein